MHVEKSPRGWHGPQSSGHVPHDSPVPAAGLSHTWSPHTVAGGLPLDAVALGDAAGVTEVVLDAEAGREGDWDAVEVGEAVGLWDGAREGEGGGVVVMDGEEETAGVVEALGD